MSDDEPSERRPADGESDTDDETAPPGPATGPSPDDDTTSAGSRVTADSDASAPFDELDSEVGSDTGDVDGLFEEMFTEAETDEMDTEAVWDELEETGEETVWDDPGGTDEDTVWDELEETDGETGSGGPGETDGETIWDKLEETASGGHDRDLDGTEHVVQTSSFCEQCEYVDDPPEARCTYDGSEIVEFVDEEHVRVKNCPIVARREGIGEID